MPDINEALVSATQPCPVSSYNEWDPLEEVIVGRVDGATIPGNHRAVRGMLPNKLDRLLPVIGGLRYPKRFIAQAQEQLAEFIEILESADVLVRRPEAVDFRRKFRTPHWSSRGFSNSCPRDGLMVVGDEIIETPMSWPTRHFEGDAYRPLFKEYFQQGARWTSAPRPQLLDDLFNHDYTPPNKGEPLRYVVNEWEPVFDAADSIRCGRDIFIQRSNVTNESGIEWLRRHLAPEYRVHQIETVCPQPMHIDSTMLPLAPGKLLINPDYVDVDLLPPFFDSWEKLVAPAPDSFPSFMSMTSSWISVNVLSLDTSRVVVEKGHVSLIRDLEKWGFEPIPCSFDAFTMFGGAFHCATLDIRRRGELESFA